MVSHTVSSYEEDLNFLKSSICKMIELTSRLIDICNQSLTNANSKLIEEARSIDHSINIIDIEVEERSVSLIALRQPMSIDLRQVIASLKLAVIIERTGDLLKNVIKRLCKIEIKNFGFIESELTDLLHYLKLMISDSLISYQKMKDDSLINIFKYEYQIDEIYSDTLKKLQEKCTEISDLTIDEIMQAIFIFKNLERVGDYIVKIAQFVPYIKDGKKITKSDIKNLTDQELENNE